MCYYKVCSTRVNKCIYESDSANGWYYYAQSVWTRVNLSYFFNEDKIKMIKLNCLFC